MPHLLDPNVRRPEEDLWHHEPLVVHSHLDVVSVHMDRLCCDFPAIKKQRKTRNILGVANSPTVLHLQASHWSPQHSS